MDSLHAVVAEAGEVPRRLERLRVAGGIGGAAGELVLARQRVPRETPVHPAMRVSLVSDRRAAPVTIDAKFDTLDRRRARPGAAGDRYRSGFDDAPARIEVGNAGRRHQRVHAHQRARLALLARHAAKVIAARLL